MRHEDVAMTLTLSGDVRRGTAVHIPTGTEVAARIGTPSDDVLRDEAALRHVMLRQLHDLLDVLDEER